MESEPSKSGGETAPAGAVIVGEPLSRESEVWLEISKKILDESRSVEREFSKFMIQFSFGAIPVFVALFNLVNGKQPSPVAQHWMPYLPIGLFALCSVLFTFAYFPQRVSFLLDVPIDIKVSYQRLLLIRRRLNLSGLLVYVIATVCAGIILIQEMVP